MKKPAADQQTSWTPDSRFENSTTVDPSLLELALAPLKGTRRWLALGAIPVGVVFMGVGIFSLWSFMNAESVSSLIQWALAFVFCMGAVSMMKIWYWMEMQGLILTRHVKGLELQVSRLEQQLTPPSAN